MSDDLKALVEQLDKVAAYFDSLCECEPDQPECVPCQMRDAVVEASAALASQQGVERALAAYKKRGRGTQTKRESTPPCPPRSMGRTPSE